MTNDELRQAWMGEVVPFMDEVGIDVPAHHDGERWVIDCAFPRAFDEDAKSWGEEITWDEVMTRWKARGPMNRDYVDRLQRAHR
jgi:ring-1,2-phenylacetyl-CoA epoxidase subunit PaaA